METLDHYRAVIQTLLEEHAAGFYLNGDYRRELVIDRDRDHYLLLSVGFDRGRRIHSVLFHLDIRDGKIWIEQNNTDIELAPFLVEAGVPKEHIVIGLLSPDVRADTDYAVA